MLSRWLGEKGGSVWVNALLASASHTLILRVNEIEPWLILLFVLGKGAAEERLLTRRGQKSRVRSSREGMRSERRSIRTMRTQSIELRL